MEEGSSTASAHSPPSSTAAKTVEFSFDDVFDTHFDDGSSSHSSGSRSPSPPLPPQIGSDAAPSDDTAAKPVAPSASAPKTTSAHTSSSAARISAASTSPPRPTSSLTASLQQKQLLPQPQASPCAQPQKPQAGVRQDAGGSAAAAMNVSRAQLGTPILPGALGLAMAHSAPQPSSIVSPRVQTSGRARRRSRKKKSSAARAITTEDQQQPQPQPQPQPQDGGMTVCSSPVTASPRQPRHWQAHQQQQQQQQARMFTDSGRVVDESSAGGGGGGALATAGVGEAGTVAGVGATSNAQANPTLVLKNLPFDLKAEALLGVLHGLAHPPENVALHYDSNGSFRGMAFVRYHSMSEAAEVHRVLNGLDISGRQVRIEYKRKPEGEEQRVAQAWREQLHQFKEDESGPQELTFPSTLTSAQRRQIHTIADKLGLVHYSQREGESRILIVSKRSRSIKINGRGRSNSVAGSGAAASSLGSPSAHSYGSSWSDRGAASSWSERNTSASLYGSSWSEREQHSPNSSAAHFEVGSLGSSAGSWRPRSVGGFNASSPSVPRSHRSPSVSTGSVGRSRSSPFRNGSGASSGGVSARQPGLSSSYSQGGIAGGLGGPGSTAPGLVSRERRLSFTRDRSDSTPAFIPSRQPRGPTGPGFTNKHQQHIAAVLALLAQSSPQQQQQQQQQQESESVAEKITSEPESTATTSGEEGTSAASLEPTLSDSPRSVPESVTAV
jgi:R3H domain/RNA recognition motif